VEQQIILRVDAEPDAINPILRQYTTYLNEKIEKSHISMYFEPHEHGVVLIFKSLEDCTDFHNLLRFLAENVTDTTELDLNKIHFPQEITINPLKLTFHLKKMHENQIADSIIENIFHSYKAVDPGIRFTRISLFDFEIYFSPIEALRKIISTIYQYLVTT
jgi:hypothetical protein